MLLAFSMCFTSVCPALAAENTAVETEDVSESVEAAPEEENIPSEEADTEEVNVDETADEAVSEDADTEESVDEEISEAAGTEESAVVQEATVEGIEEDVNDVADASSSQEQETGAVETAADPELADTVTGIVEGQTSSPCDSGEESPEELFEKYVEKEFGILSDSEMQNAKKTTGTRLTGMESAIYTKIAGIIPEIAAGERASTVIEIPLEDLGLEQTSWTKEELGVSAILQWDDSAGKYVFTQEAQEAVSKKVSFDLDLVDNALLADFPYDMYWYDKARAGASTTSGPKFSVNSSYIRLTSGITFSMTVAQEFADETYIVNTQKAHSVQTAVANANAVVDTNSDSGAWDKLTAYKNYICENVSYNDGALASGTAYGNPWQMIWVFDEDPDTKVVCEGYSKAFKYLCDKSDIDCILVTGTMGGGTGAGDHMWNIVTLDGTNYLVDVTNTDDGTIGEDGSLFMQPSGNSGSPEYTQKYDENGKVTGYTFGTVNYAYDAETLGYFTNDELKLGSSHVHDLKKTEAKDATCTEAGNKEYWTCSRCEKVFSDEAGTTETTVDAMTIAALGHEMVHTEANEATCTEAGNKEYWTCSRCEKVFSDEAGTTETTVEAMTIAAKGHDWSRQKQLLRP